MMTYPTLASAPGPDPFTLTTLDQHEHPRLRLVARFLPAPLCCGPARPGAAQDYLSEPFLGFGRAAVADARGQVVLDVLADVPTPASRTNWRTRSWPPARPDDAGYRDDATAIVLAVVAGFDAAQSVGV